MRTNFATLERRTSRPHRPSRPRRHRPTLAVLLASLTLATAGFAAPVAAAPREREGTNAGTRSVPAAAADPGNVQKGRRADVDARATKVRVNAKAAARAAELAPRTSRVHERLAVPSRGQRGTPVTARGANLVDARAAATTSAVAPLVVATQPAPVVTQAFDGTTEAEACGCEPPDPWIAVSPSHVVQSTNGFVRISNRAGGTLVTMPSWALFAIPSDRFDADPRIIWDTFHSRWVGVILSARPDFTANALHLAVSETSDPTGAWIVYPINTGIYLPDYPGISSSGDKVVLTSNDFQNGAVFVGPSAYVIDWANILAGTNLFVGGFFEDSTVAHYRPAQMLTNSSRIPVIYHGPSLFAPWYFEIVGTAATAAKTATTNLSSSFTIATFSDPPDPVQPGGIAISNAVDRRPTDAVYRGGVLWFTATGAFNDGSLWAASRYTRVATPLNGTGPTAAADFFAFDSGTHFFQPGIGINGAGTLVLMTTKTDLATYPTTMFGAVATDLSIHSLVDLEASTASYTGNRWGDYVGIAADPSAAGAVWMAHELVTADGSWRTRVARIVSDGVLPGLPGTVSQVQIVPATLGATVPVRTSWTAATDAHSGIAGYLVERSDDGGPYVGIRTPGTSITAALTLGHTYRYRVSALDAVGNTSAPRYGPLYKPTLYQSSSSTTYTGTWATSTSSAFSGGSARASSTANATATFTATLARSISIVATKAASRGSFKVYVDGVLKGTISTYSATTRYRQLVYQFRWSTAGTHKIKVVVSGTSGHPRVDLDAFVVLR
jgi:hypothetical protein